MENKCKNCNSNLNYNDIFCPHCGQKTENSINGQTISEQISKDIRKNIKKLKLYQYIIICLFFIIVIFNIAYPTITSQTYKNQIPPTTSYVKNYLSNLDPNKEAFYSINSFYIYVYQTDYDGKLVVYRFDNSSQYTSTNKEQFARATVTDLKKHFSNKIRNGVPPKTYVLQNYYIVIVIINSLLILSATLLIIKISRQVKDIFRVLKKNHSHLIELNNKFENDLISKQEFNKARRSFFNKLINNNNLFCYIFKALY